MKKIISLIAITILITSISLTPTSALSADSSQPNSDMKKDYILVLKDKALSDDIPNKYGITKTHKFEHALNGMVIKASQSQIDNLKKDERVLFIEEDRTVEIFAQSLPTGIDRMNADLNPISGIDGVDNRVDVDVAIIDTGIEKTHPDLNIAGGVNLIGTDSLAWNDGNGHGTHVAGTVAALDNNVGVVGVAPGARLWAVKVLSDTGSGALSDVIKGIDWVTAHSSTIDVVNMSLGGGGIDDGNCGKTNGDSMHYAICNSVAKGVVYVVAAGNSNADASNSVPAAYDEVITVSAIADFDGKGGALGVPTCRTDEDDSFANFSNFGQDVDIAAPGVCILSTWKGGSYNTISGTSMASPHVAGDAALFIAKNGKPIDYSGVFKVKQALINTGIPQTNAAGFFGDPDSFREPLVNAGDPVSNTPQPEPIPLYDVAVNSITIPTTVKQGDVVTVYANVQNAGTTTQTFDVLLKDLTDGNGYTGKTITLYPGNSATMLLSWNTKYSPLGTNIMEVRATKIINETNFDNNAKTSPVNVVIGDTILPTVSFITPSEGATINGIISVGINATDNNGISKIEFYVDGSLYGASNIYPTSFSIDTTTYQDGQHAFKAVAYDTANNIGSTQISVVVKNSSGDTTPPTLVLPSTITVEATSANTLITYTVTATDNSDANPTVTCNPASGSKFTIGAITVNCTAVDTSGNISTGAFVINVIDKTLPSVTITNPSNAQKLSDRIVVSASVSDNIGISKTETYIDGVIKSTLYSGPWDFSWNTKNVKNGEHSISVITYDMSGNKASALVKAYVENNGQGKN